MFGIATQTSWKMSSINILWTVQENFPCFSLRVGLQNTYTEEFFQRRHLKIVCRVHMSHVAFHPRPPFRKKKEKSKIYLIIVHLFQSLYHSDVFLNIGLFWRKRNTRHSGSRLSLGAVNAQVEISPAENNASAQERQSLNDFSPVQIDACV